jgi:hypothetical protein
MQAQGGTLRTESLKQAPRVWYETFATAMRALGYDASVFYNNGMILALYVDDLLITRPRKDEIQRIKTELQKRFQMSDLGPCAFYLGMQVTRDRATRTLKLSQEGYIKRVLEDFGMESCAGSETPMDPSLKLRPADKEYDADAVFKRQYRSAVGSLMYAMLGTRPDIAFAVSKISQFALNPNQVHWQAVKRVFRYLKATSNLCLEFRGPLKSLSGYSDAAWAGDMETRRSISGYVFNVGSGAISWSSKRQPTVSLSSCEAELKGET